MDTFSITLQLIITGFSIGAIFALIALGLSLIWGTSRIINIAHGEFIVIGAFITLFLHNSGLEESIPILGPLLGPFIFFPISGLIVGAIGVIIQYILYNRVVGKEPLISLILGFGVSIILAALLVILFTGDFRSMNTPFSSQSFNFGDLSIKTGEVFAIILSFGIFAFTFLFMEKTDTGRAIRAVSQDRDAALLMGVNDTNIFLTAMFLSGFVAGAAGNVVAILYSFTPNSGPTYMGWSFVISVLAGLGTIQGVLIAGIIIGIVRSLTTFVSSELFSVSGIEQAIGFILMILVILIRPLGLFGRRSE
jgi:branched-chain amino acid transport system permease protein